MLEPKLWGPLMWYLLHIVSYTYQLKLSHYYPRFFQAISDILPCPHCQTHYDNHLEKYPPPLENQTALTEWVVDIHNRVNLFRKTPIYTPEDAEDLYKVNEKYPVNHTYIVQLFLIIKDSEITTWDLLGLLELLVPIFPCEECRQFLIKYSKTSDPTLKGYMKIINSHVLSDEETELLNLQKFQFGEQTRSLIPKGANFILTKNKQDKKSLDKHIKDVLAFNKLQNCHSRIKTRVQKLII